MEWLDTLSENLSAFWNMPVSIIGFSVGTIIIGACFIIGKTQLGKKAFNKVKKMNEELQAKLKDAIDLTYTLNEQFKSYKAEKEEEITRLTEDYQIKLSEYKNYMVKQDELIKVICENSPNKAVKSAFEEYTQVELDLPTNEVIERIKEETRVEYEDRIKAIEDLVYGEERKEEEND